MTDPIVDEVREIRAAIAARFGYDRARFHAWAREESSRTQTDSMELLPPIDRSTVSHTLIPSAPQYTES